MKKILTLFVSFFVIHICVAETAFTGKIITGKPTEKDWCACSGFSNFKKALNNTMPYAYKTEFKVLYSKTHLYILAIMQEPEMSALNITAPAVKGWPRHDSCELFIAPFTSRTNYIQLAAGCNGTQYDSRMKQKKWAVTWQVEVSVQTVNWQCLFSIPFNDLKIPCPAVGTIWGFNICRNRKISGIRRSGTWAKVGRKFHNPGGFGELVFGSREEAFIAQVKALENKLKKIQHDVYLSKDNKLKKAVNSLSKQLKKRDKLSVIAKKIIALTDELKAVNSINNYKKKEQN